MWTYVSQKARENQQLIITWFYQIKVAYNKKNIVLPLIG